MKMFSKGKLDLCIITIFCVQQGFGAGLPLSCWQRQWLTQQRGPRQDGKQREFWGQLGSGVRGAPPEPGLGSDAASSALEIPSGGWWRLKKWRQESECRKLGTDGALSPAGRNGTAQWLQCLSLYSQLEVGNRWNPWLVSGSVCCSSLQISFFSWPLHLSSCFHSCKNPQVSFRLFVELFVNSLLPHPFLVLTVFSFSQQTWF